MLDSVNFHLHQFSELAHKFAFDIVFAPLKTQLEDIATMEVGWAEPNYLEQCIAPIAQSVSALDFNFERAVEGSILTAGKNIE